MIRPARPLVLIADGHADTCELYATFLRPLGFETTTISDDTEAFATAWQMRPDIIVTEVSAPGFTGWEFIHDLKREPRTRDIPVVVVTSDGSPCARVRAVRAGCAAFRLKPCLPEDLAATLQEIVNGAHTHEQASSAH